MKKKKKIRKTKITLLLSSNEAGQVNCSPYNYLDPLLDNIKLHKYPVKVLDKYIHIQPIHIYIGYKKQMVSNLYLCGELCYSIWLVKYIFSILYLNKWWALSRLLLSSNHQPNILSVLPDKKLQCRQLQLNLSYFLAEFCDKVSKIQPELWSCSYS